MEEAREIGTLSYQPPTIQLSSHFQYTHHIYRSVYFKLTLKIQQLGLSDKLVQFHENIKLKETRTKCYGVLGHRLVFTE